MHLIYEYQLICHQQYLGKLLHGVELGATWVSR